MKSNNYSGLRFNNGIFSKVEDVLAVEESLSISLNNEPFTVTMRTPGFEKQLVRGLLYTEEVYRNELVFSDLEITSTGSNGHITGVNIILPEAAILKDFVKSRNLVSASSCGLCGRTSFEETISSRVVSYEGVIHPSLIFNMFEHMADHQFSFIKTGGTHASAAFLADGTMLSVMEDIGRHNAVDKVIGDLLDKKKLNEANVLLVSGRISYEIVNKVVSAGIPILASVSAPSDMAVNIAAKSGVTLMAFCRTNKLTVYSNPERIKIDKLQTVNNT